MSQLLYTIQRRGRGLGCGCNRRGISDIWDEYQYADQQNYFLESGGGYGSDFYYGGGGGGSFANPPDNWSGNTGIFNWNWDTGNYNTPGINPDPNGGGIFDGSGWFDPYSGLYFDPYGGVYDTLGTGIFDNQDTTPLGVDEYGNPLIRFNTDETITPDTSINLQDLQSTLDWWNQISTDPDLATVTLPNITYDAGYILNTPTSVIENDPQAPKLPNGQKLPAKVIEALKKAAAAVLAKRQAAAGGSSSGGNSAAGKPATTQPNAQGQCPQGYVLNPQTKQCVLIPAKPNSDLLTTLTSNPLYLMLGAIGLILLVKK